jgi:hypothetical protein
MSKQKALLDRPLPPRVEESHRGFKIGIERDSRTIRPYCERNLDREGKETAYAIIRDGYSVNEGMPDADSVVDALNSLLGQSCAGIDHEVARKIMERQLKAFYPEKKN